MDLPWQINIHNVITTQPNKQLLSTRKLNCKLLQRKVSKMKRYDCRIIQFVCKPQRYNAWQTFSGFRRFLEKTLLNNIFQISKPLLFTHPRHCCSTGKGISRRFPVRHCSPEVIIESRSVQSSSRALAQRPPLLVLYPFLLCCTVSVN